MIKINLKSSTPIYEQIIEGFKEHIFMGNLKSGDIIPSVRRLAADIGVNPNTVGKAYLEMEKQGMIITQRGKGTYVAELTELRYNEVIFLKTELKNLVDKAITLGLKNDEIIEMLKSTLDELETKEGQN